MDKNKTTYLDIIEEERKCKGVINLKGKWTFSYIKKNIEEFTWIYYLIC